MTATLAIYPSHDANITFKSKEGIYRVFEIERLTKKRYDSLLLVSNPKEIYQQVYDLIIKEFGDVNFNICYTLQLPQDHKDMVASIFGDMVFEDVGHHYSHAACAFYQSSFDESLIISFDGGGFDGGEGDERVTFFNIYLGKRANGIEKLISFPYNLGTAYGLLAVPISEIIKTEEDWGDKFLSFAGKKMGLCAYGNIREEWIEPLITFYKEHKHGDLTDFAKSLKNKLGQPLRVNNWSAQDSYDLAASSQEAFERTAMHLIEPYLEQYSNLPVVLTGGCALNVLFNQKLKDKISRDIFIPPNPSNCGLSFGMIAYHERPANQIDLTYAGIPLLDLDKLPELVKFHSATPWSIQSLANNLTRSRMIIGIAHGRSEHGPRALGNRSILCDPRYVNMKNDLNTKVKFREWYRPFAPVCRLEDVEKYFHFSGESRFMTYSPEVREEWRNKIPAIVHKDNTARVQTVTHDQNALLYDLLTEVEKITGIGILLNTSFNIKGRPILSTCEDAISVLLDTKIHRVIVDDYLFGDNFEPWC